MARSVLELLEDINSQGATIIMVTHDPELAARAQRNVHIVDGMATDLSVEPSLSRVANASRAGTSVGSDACAGRVRLLRQARAPQPQAKLGARAEDQTSELAQPL